MIERQRMLYLCRPNGRLLTQLNGVQTDSVNYSVNVKDYNEIEFNVDRFLLVDDKLVQSNGYDDLHIGMNVLLEGLDMFVLQEPTVVNDGWKEYKTVKGYSLEHEFQEKDWKGLKVNTGETDSLEYTIDENLDDFGFPIQFITLYKGNDSGQTQYSLLHYILEKMPGWSIDDDDIDGVLWDRKVSIDESNINLYGLLTSVIGPKAECIFLFDTINKKIKAIAKESLDEPKFDTNIFISMRNLAQSINISVDEDSVFTVFNAAGENDTIDVAPVNYNDKYLYDLSYFMGEPWMPQSTADKIRAWAEWREDNREDFTQLSKDLEIRTQLIKEIVYKVPNDGDMWDQWERMGKEELNKAIEVYENYLLALRKDADDDPAYDSNGDYIVRTTSGGEVDEAYYEGQLFDKKKGYYTYIEVRDYCIPNIKIAISNKGIVEKEKTDYIKEYETNWELYGIVELEGKEEKYLGMLNEVLDKFCTEWNDLTPEQKQEFLLKGTYEFYNSEYQEILGYLGQLNESTGLYTEGSLRRKLQELREEKAAMEAEVEEIQEEILEYVDKAKIDNPYWGMTEDELILFSELCRFTDYQNNNIIITTSDTSLTKIDICKDLYDDSVSKLSEVSQPQYQFSVDMDNFFDIPEFRSWRDKFELCRFIRVGIRDDYSVKLRLVGYTTNPCEIDEMLSVQFSNFITSKSGRSDLLELIDNENNRGSKNSISVGTGGTTDQSELTKNLLYMLSRAGMLSSMNTSNSSSTTATNATFGGTSTADLIRLHTTTGYIADATMSEAKVTDYLDAVKINSATVTAGTIIADRFLLKNGASGILYQLNNMGNLSSESTDTLDGYTLTDRTIACDKIVAQTITVNEITADNLVGTNGWINLHDGTFWYGGRRRSAQNCELSWDGSTLKIVGAITATDGGNIGGYYVSTESADDETSAEGGHAFMESLYSHARNNTYEYEVGMTTGQTDNGTGWLLPEQYAFYVTRINTGNTWTSANRTDLFYVKHNGSMYAKDADIEGKITATSGSIGGWNITSTQINSTGTTSGLITGLQKQDSGVWAIAVGATTMSSWADAPFRVRHDGEMWATNAHIEGNVDAKSGTFGSGTNKINIGTDSTHSSIYYGTQGMSDTSHDGFYIGTNGIALGKGVFTVTSKGKLTATDADIKGKITATSGEIGDWKIDTGKIYIQPDSSHFVVLNNGMNQTGDVLVVRLGEGTEASPYTYPFALRSDGSVLANKATIRGVLTADAESKIGPWTITATSICKVSRAMGNSAAGAAYFGDDGLSVTDKFKVNSAGKLTATGADIEGKITATTGTIGGWNITSTQINSTSSGGLITGLQKQDAGTWAIAVGATAMNDWSTAPFRIKHDGTGIIGGFDITSTAIKTKDIAVTSNSNNSISLSSSDFTRTVAGESRTNLRLAIGSRFGVTNTGKIYASDVSIKGAVTAESGYIGNFIVDSTGLSIMNDGENSCLFLGNRAIKLFVGPYDTSIYDKNTWVSGYSGFHITNQYIKGRIDSSTNPCITISNDGEISGSSLKISSRLYGGLTVSGDITLINGTIKNSTSDIRLKKNIRKTDASGLDIINAINMYQFDWKENNVHQNLGFIADYLEDIDEKFTTGGGYNDDGSMNIKSVNSFYLQGYEVKAIQELSEENRMLKQRIERLENLLNK